VKRFAMPLLLLSMAAAWGWTLFPDPAYLRLGDWDQYLTFFEVQRRSYVEYGELPLWNPYLLGGVPAHGHPQFNSLSPYLLPILLFELPVAAAVFFTLHAATGLLGAYLLARHLGNNRSAATLAGLCFLFCFAPYLSGGVVNRVNGSLIPWLAFFYLRSLSQPRWLVALALTFTLLILEGGFYALVGGGLLLGVLSVFCGSAGKIVKAWVVLGLALLLGVGMGLVRLVPTVELYAQYPRHTEFFAGAAILNGEALARLPAALGALLAAPNIGQRPLLFDQPIFCGTNLGLPLLSLLLLAAVYCWRRWAVWLLAALFASLVLAKASPVNSWALLTKLPGLQSLNLSMSLLFCLFLPLGWLAAGSLTAWCGRAFRGAQVRGGISWLIVLGGALLPLLLQNREVLARHPTYDLPAIRTDVPFEQELGQRLAMLPTVRANHGVVDAYEEVIRERLPRRVLPKGHPGYRGEWFLAGSGRADLQSFSPGRREFAFDCPASDRLTLNENSFPGWQAQVNGESVAVEDQDGLLSVAVPAGQGTLELSYRPGSFLWAGAASLTFLCLSLFFATTRGGSLLRGLATDCRVGSFLAPPEHCPARRSHGAGGPRLGE
jgi:hypothetical protein